jgi:hypothetical protein
MTPVPDENTSGREDARKAVQAARASSRRADTLIANVGRDLGLARAHRESNHFADKFRDIIRGSAHA